SALPGFSTPAASDPKSEPMSAAPAQVVRGPDFRPGSGTTPPRLVVQHEPEFSEPARAAKYQGTVTLKVVVTQEGVPANIRILTPLGCGLDAKAVQAVESWKFTPAERSGQAITTELLIEVNFHLY
ncbi:MAG TPA: energy transducer TonB, partial [Candidatus Binatus sp.]|nr:energy transducer TonB [Candidatus Binatus sp.]